METVKKSVLEFVAPLSWPKNGSGYGYGSGYGVAMFNGEKVFYIDEIPTILTGVFGNIAKGKILRDDLTLEPCYVARNGNIYAHGETVMDSNKAIADKIFEQMGTEEKIKIFVKEFPDLDAVYPAKTFYEWHHKLTGSCEMGRKQFLSSHGYDLENGHASVREFLTLTENAYGGYVIRKLKDRYREEK